MRLTLKKSDAVGALASGLCLVHCMVTPLLFIAQSCSAACCIDAPLWWRWIDYVFLVISLFAVYHSAKRTSANWMKPAMWISWILLCLAILKEHLEWISVPEGTTYMAAFMLVALHLFNLAYCQCKTDKCCSNDE
ncbi:MAG: MerC domain-containing protein [Fluviicola sp.]